MPYMIRYYIIELNQLGDGIKLSTLSRKGSAKENGLSHMSYLCM